MTPSPEKIIQWNINGFYAHFVSLQLLINQESPVIIGLQETNFKQEHVAKIRNYRGVARNRPNTAHASGGIGIYVHNKF